MPIEISVLGCRHPQISDVLGVIASEPDVRLAAAWDADRSAVPGQISSYAVADADTAIRRADAVVIYAPTDERPELCVRAARAGRPLLVANPLALTAGEARRLAREVSRSRSPAVVAFFLRELPALARLRGVLRGGVLGRLSSVSASYLQDAALNGSLQRGATWMLDPPRAGVGGLGDLTMHLVDALAVLGSVPHLHAISIDRGPAGSTDLGGAAIGKWNDVPLSLRSSWVTRPSTLELTVNGALASAVVRDGALELVSEGGVRERWVGAPPDAGEALRAFTTRLRTRRFAGDGLAAAVRAHEVLERAVQLE